MLWRSDEGILGVVCEGINYKAHIRDAVKEIDRPP